MTQDLKPERRGVHTLTTFEESAYGKRFVRAPSEASISISAPGRSLRSLPVRSATHCGEFPCVTPLPCIRAPRALSRAQACDVRCSHEVYLLDQVKLELSCICQVLALPPGALCARRFTFAAHSQCSVRLMRCRVAASLRRAPHACAASWAGVQVNKVPILMPYGRFVCRQNTRRSQPTASASWIMLCLQVGSRADLCCHLQVQQCCVHAPDVPLPLIKNT
jgi:hypothetical protein